MDALSNLSALLCTPDLTCIIQSTAHYRSVLLISCHSHIVDLTHTLPSLIAHLLVCLFVCLSVSQSVCQSICHVHLLVLRNVTKFDVQLRGGLT